MKEESDTLGAFSGHGLSSFWGLICCGAFATLEVGTKEGLFYGGREGARLFGVNILFAVVASAYSFVLMVIVYFLTLRLV
jgi:ammonia channel protein AmtB